MGDRTYQLAAISRARAWPARVSALFYPPSWSARRAAIVAGLLVLAFALGGCGTRTGATGTTLRIWYSTDDPVERVWSQQLARRFEARHPGTRVDLADYSFEDLNTKLQLALAAGDPPDLAYVTPRGPGIPAYVGAHLLLDLSAAARDRHWAQKLRPGLLAGYNHPFGFEGAKRGSVVGVPMSLAAVAVLYNQRLLRRLHLALPTTFAAFETALARARAAGVTPLGLGNADGWLGDDWYLTLVNALVRPAALQPEQDLSRGFTFRRPPFLRAARILRRWADRSYFTRDFGGLDAQEGIDQFFQGHTLFQLVSSSENAQIRRESAQTGMPIRIFAFPGMIGPVVPQAGYLGWVVPAASHHPAEAIDFIQSILSPSISDFLARQGALPAARARLNGSLPVWQQEYARAVATAHPGIYLDAAPIANLNGTMEANVQLLLQGYEAPTFLVKSLEEVYSSRGKSGSTARIDGEF